MSEKNPDELGALWEKNSNKGPYFTGTINGERVVVFKNDKKGNEKAPDWRILKAKPREETAPVTGARVTYGAYPPPAALTDDDVPF